MNRETIEKLGWKPQGENPIVMTYLFSNYRMYWDWHDKFTIQECWNGFIEYKNIFTGRMQTEEELHQWMRDHKLAYIKIPCDAGME